MGQINTYQDLVEAIEQDGVQQTVRANRKPPLHTRILRELYELYPDVPEYVEFLAYYPLIPSDLAEKVANEMQPDQTAIAEGLASNPRSSQITLNRLCEHPSAAVRLALASNPNLTPKEFQQLVQDENHFVRAVLAANPSLPSPLQFILAADESSAVRIALASRKSLDPDVAVRLGEDVNFAVRAAIIQTWSQDPELLHHWAESDDHRNQALLLKRPGPLETGILQTLTISPHPKVSHQAIEMSGLRGPLMLSLAESDDPDDRIFLAGQSDLPAAIQRMLAQDASIKVRRRLAANTELDAGIALHIASSEELSSCRMLAQNPSISDACISLLCTHPEDQIGLLVAYREDLQAEHFDLLLNERSTTVVAEHLAFNGPAHEFLREARAEELAQSPVPSVRAFAAYSSEIPPATLRQLARDAYQPTRLAVAQNLRTPEATLKLLSEESDREIVFAAEDTFSKQIAQRPGKESPTVLASEEEDPRPDDQRPLLKKIAHFFKE